MSVLEMALAMSERWRVRRLFSSAWILSGVGDLSGTKKQGRRGVVKNGRGVPGALGELRNKDLTALSKEDGGLGGRTNKINDKD